MTQREYANMIIGLRKEGWSDTKINNFMLFVETHTPSEDETKERQEKSED